MSTRGFLAAASGLALLGASVPAASAHTPAPAPAPAPARDGVYRFVGGGFGHGVGMSQWGAKGMADQGWSAEAILTHYYRGTSIQPAKLPSLRVHLLDQPAPLYFTTSSDVLVTNDGGPEHAYINAPDTLPPGVVFSDDTGFYLTQGTNLLMGPVAGPLVLRFDGSLDPGLAAMVRLHASPHRYRHGRIEISRIPGSFSLRAVARDLPMNRYLYGLGEVPALWPPEAQKAQAIAARTYALEKVARLGQMRPQCSCGVLGTTADQNYVAYEKEAGLAFDNWKRAVDQTDSKVVTFDGSPIQAFYSSSSGGYTENSENVFFSPLPYLRGVPDPWDELVSPTRIWNRSYTSLDLERWLNSQPDTAVGALRGIELRPPFGVSGRIIKPSAGTPGGGVHLLAADGRVKQVSGERFRQVVNAGLASEGRLSEILLSTLFQPGFQPFGRTFQGGVFPAGGRHESGWIVASGAGEGGGPHVLVTDKAGSPRASFFAYDDGFRGGVRLAVCDLDADGRAEIVSGAGPGGGPHVRIFTADGVPRAGFFAYAPEFAGGVYVACGNVDGAPGDEILTGAGPGGGPHVRVFRGDLSPIGSFFAYDLGFRGGVRVAAGNLNGAGPAEVVTGAGPGGGPDVRSFTLDGTRLSAFYAYDPVFTGGVYVSTLPGVGDGKSSIVTGAGEGGGSHLKVLTMEGNLVWEMAVFGGFMANGLRVGSVDGKVLTGAGPGAWPVVRPVP
ncbi:MAG: SpoIID/LytB domain-containing protein [Actinomycetota bacterium]